MDEREALAHQFDLIDAAAAQYDAGDADAALRLAGPLRAIFHGTAGRPSLIAGLGGRVVRMLTTAEKAGAGVAAHPALVTWDLRPQDSIFACVPRLGATRGKRFVAADFWWGNEPVYQDHHSKLHRRDLVLHAA